MQYRNDWTTIIRFFFTTALLFFGGAGLLASDMAPKEAATFFESEVRPLLAAKCIQCHGGNKQEGNLRLDTLEGFLNGGDSGPSIVPGEPDESMLIEAIRYESYEMPPNQQMSDDEIAVFVKWVQSGAQWPEHAGEVREAAGQISDEDREWWAYLPLKKPEIPAEDGDGWAQGEIDRFVLHKMIEKGIEPAPEADKATLIRRLYFDVIGLPPTPAEIEAFLTDTDPHAWEKLVDRLLADKRYGEHWGRYWLDVVRFAESDGFNLDSFRPHLWRYRDYVVQSFNEDKPYPLFVKEQLAGDEMPGDDPDQLVATGYLRLGIYEYNQRDARSHWNDIMNEMVDVTADVFLGTAMACARCHDHKFDPVLQADYFRLRAFFEPIEFRDDLVYATEEEKEEYQRQLKIWNDAVVDIQTEINDLIKPYHDRKWVSTVEKFPLDIQEAFHKPVSERTSWDQQMSYLISRQFVDEGGGPLRSMSKEDKAKHEALLKKLDEFKDLKPDPLPPLMAATDFNGAISPTHIPDREQLGPINPGFPTVLSAVSTTMETVEKEHENSSGRRTELAEWIASEENPLTTRVIVNRIWQQHFGQGIVPTPNDFGHMGQPPTHPELLDWLTLSFIENGWSFKTLHKQILMSATWRQSADHPKAAEFHKLDPGDLLIWRSRVNRLRAEQIRDAMLLVSGELNPEMGGPSVDGKVPRRSLYVIFKRNTPDSFLSAFDIANGLTSVAERNVTTTPTQSLMMINGEFSLARAKKFGENLQEEHQGESTESLLADAFERTWGRQPNAEEQSSALTFLGAADAGAPVADIPPDALTDFCHVLLNSNEFLYVD